MLRKYRMMIEYARISYLAWSQGKSPTEINNTIDEFVNYLSRAFSYTPEEILARIEKCYWFKT